MRPSYFNGKYVLASNMRLISTMYRCFCSTTVFFAQCVDTNDADDGQQKKDKT